MGRSLKGRGNVQEGSDGVLAGCYNNTSKVEKGGMAAVRTEGAARALLTHNELPPGMFVTKAMMFYSDHRSAIEHGN